RPVPALLAGVRRYQVGEVGHLVLGPPILDLVVVGPPDVRRRPRLDRGQEAVVALGVVWNVLEGDREALLLADGLEALLDQPGGLGEVVDRLPDHDRLAGAR